MVKPILPSLDGLNRIDSMATGEAIRALNNTMKQLTKELEHAFYNLDDENFNEVEWNNITSPIYAQIEDNKENIATLQLVADRFDLMVSGIGEDGQVTAASIVAAINDAGSEITIAADKINFEGFTTFVTGDELATELGDYATLTGLSSGTTTINGGCITTGAINASLITTGYLSANRISGGEISSSTFKSTYGSRIMQLTSGKILFAETDGNGGMIYYDTGSNTLAIGATDDIGISNGSSDTISTYTGHLDLFATGDITLDTTEGASISLDNGDVTIDGDMVYIDNLYVDYRGAGNVPVINSSSNYKNIRLAFTGTGVVVSSGSSVLGNLLFD